MSLWVKAERQEVEITTERREPLIKAAAAQEGEMGMDQPRTVPLPGAVFQESFPLRPSIKRMLSQWLAVAAAVAATGTTGLQAATAAGQAAAMGRFTPQARGWADLNPLAAPTAARR
jgi:hypothetical protein